MAEKQVEQKPATTAKDDEPLFSQAAPESVSLATINKENEKYWKVPYSKAEKFGNE